MNIKKLLEAADAFEGLPTVVSVLHENEQINNICDSYTDTHEPAITKLREIVDILPAIKELLKANVDSAKGFGDKKEQIEALTLKAKVDNWENES